MLGNSALAETCQPVGEEEERMRQFFLERVRIDPLLDGQNYIYMHYADMIAATIGYTLPVPNPRNYAQPRRRDVFLRKQ